MLSVVVVVAAAVLASMWPPNFSPPLSPAGVVRDGFSSGNYPVLVI